MAGSVFLLLLCLALLPFTRSWTGVLVGASGVVFATCLCVLSSSLFSATWNRGYSTGESIVISKSRRALLLPRTRAWVYVTPILGIAAALLCFVYGTQRIKGYSSWRERMLQPFSPYFGGLLLLMLAFVIVMHKWGRDPGLGLSEEGVFVWGGRGGRFIAWEWIKRIDVGTKPTAIVLEVMEPSDRERDPEENWLTRSTLFRKQSIELAGSTYAINPVGVYAALAFYHRHARARGELGDQAALNRLALNRFPDINDEIRRAGKALPAGEVVD